jgi:hypothetical protein
MKKVILTQIQSYISGERVEFSEQVKRYASGNGLKLVKFSKIF